jgi:transaldolase
VSAEVTAVDYEGMMKEGRHYAKVAENVVIKVPLIVEGLRAVRDLTAEGIRTNVTLCFSAVQALLAAKAGATYVSPFVGRLDDIAEDGMALIGQILEIFRNYDFATKVLVASVRHPIHVLEAARLGADVATIPFNVIDQLARHPLTDSGLKKFLADWEKVPKDK